VFEDLDLEGFALVDAGEDGAGTRQALVVGYGLRRWWLRPKGRRRCDLLVSRGSQADVGVVGEFLGTLAGPFGKVALGEGLPAPGDALDQPDAVVGDAGLTAEEVGVAGAEVGVARAVPTTTMGWTVRILSSLSCFESSDD
jgi:hypothetical protein